MIGKAREERKKKDRANGVLQTINDIADGLPSTSPAKNTGKGVVQERVDGKGRR